MARKKTIWLKRSRRLKLKEKQKLKQTALLDVKVEDLSTKNKIKSIHYGCCPNKMLQNVESFKCTDCQLWFHSTCISNNTKGNDKLITNDNDNDWKCFNCTTATPANVKPLIEVIYNDEMKSIDYSKTFLERENEILELKLEHVTKWIQKQFGEDIPQDLIDTTATTTTATIEVLNDKSANFNRESGQDTQDAVRNENDLLENQDLISDEQCENNGNFYDDDHQDQDCDQESIFNEPEPENNEFTSTPTTTPNDQKNNDKIEKVSSPVPVEHNSNGNGDTYLENSNPSLILKSNSKFVIPKTSVLDHYLKNIRDKNSVKPPPLPSNDPNVKVKKVLFITKSQYEKYLKQNRLKELEKEMGKEASTLQFVKKLEQKKKQTEKKVPLKKVPVSRSELIECQFCSKKFTKIGLNAHIKSRHPDPNAPKDRPSQPMKVREPSMCTECGKLIPFGRMSEHVIRHHRNESLLCPEANCGKVFNYKARLRQHMRTAHYEPAEYLNCPEEGCQKKFKNRQSLRYHQEIHEAKGTRNFSCPICDKTFATRNCFAAHKRMAHAKDVDHEFKCTFEGCNLGYSIRKYLENHMKTHDPNYQPEPPQKLNICHYCAKEYETVPQLNRHIQKVHELTSAT